MAGKVGSCRTTIRYFAMSISVVEIIRRNKKMHIEMELFKKVVVGRVKSCR